VRWPTSTSPRFRSAAGVQSPGHFFAAPVSRGLPRTWRLLIRVLTWEIGGALVCSLVWVWEVYLGAWSWVGSVRWLSVEKLGGSAGAGFGGLFWGVATNPETSSRCSSPRPHAAIDRPGGELWPGQYPAPKGFRAQPSARTKIEYVVVPERKNGGCPCCSRCCCWGIVFVFREWATIQCCVPCCVSRWWCSIFYLVCTSTYTRYCILPVAAVVSFVVIEQMRRCVRWTRSSKIVSRYKFEPFFVPVFVHASGGACRVRHPRLHEQLLERARMHRSGGWSWHGVCSAARAGEECRSLA